MEKKFKCFYDEDGKCGAMRKFMEEDCGIEWNAWKEDSDGPVFYFENFVGRSHQKVPEKYGKTRIYHILLCNVAKEDHQGCGKRKSEENRESSTATIFICCKQDSNVAIVHNCPGNQKSMAILRRICDMYRNQDEPGEKLNWNSQIEDQPEEKLDQNLHPDDKPEEKLDQKLHPDD